MGERRAAAARTRSPVKDKRGEPWAGLLYAGFWALPQISPEPRMAKAIIPFIYHFSANTIPFYSLFCQYN